MSHAAAADRVVSGSLLGHLWLATRPGDHWPRDTHSVRFEEIDPIAVSELLADLTELTAP